jgi:Rod binding domain-containing protein
MDVSTAVAVAPTPAELAKRAAITRTAKDFEASFLSTALATMFQGVGAGNFGGGQGEDAFKSFLTEAFAKQMAQGKGIGLAASVQREMLKLQGLQ